MNKYLVLWEFSKKQDYIFKSNRLKDNVGASIIMRNLSENFNEYGLDDEKFMIKGGGKNIYLFDSKEKGIEFIKDFTSTIIKKYPGLELFIVGREVDLKNKILKDEVDKLYQDLEKKKKRREHASLQLSYGMERMCNNTGMPSSYRDGSEYISSEINIKRNMCDSSQDKLFESLLPNNYRLITGIDDLVNGEKSYVAVVHIDGNGMGRRFKELNDSIVRETNETVNDFNKRYFDRNRKFSLMVTDIYENAFRNMCHKINENIDKLKDVSKIDKGFFPLRPLIMAGDDITYVCNGCIGIESARYFIEEVEKLSLSIDELKNNVLHACAGIAIVKKNYPFKKSYELAEELCANCKKAVSAVGKDVSALDFHISRGELYSSISKIRNNDYKSVHGESELTMKPLFIDSSVSWKNYSNFVFSMEQIDKAIKNNKMAKTKIKMLREEFKKGPEATEKYFKFYNIPEGCLSYFDGQSGDYCFNMSDPSKTCMYLDGIEAMDFFIKLE